MPTAQDFYNSLIKNPDYQGTLELSREELVEKEAIRRARQHRNNELALSMASEPISAMDKLFQFVNYMPLEKAYTDFDAGILNNIAQHRDAINSLTPYLESYANRGDGPDMEPGWKRFAEQRNYRNNEEYRLGPNAAMEGGYSTIFNTAEFLTTAHGILKQALDFYDSLEKDEDGNIVNPPTMGFADAMVGQPQDIQSIFDRIFDGNIDTEGGDPNPNFGQLKPFVLNTAHAFKEKAQALHEMIVDDRGPATGEGFDFRGPNREDEDDDDDDDTGGGDDTGRADTTPQTFEQRYDQYTPKQIDGDDPPPLYPKEFDEATGELGSDFKPMEGLTEENLEERFNQLKEVFRNMHLDRERSDGIPTLGSGYFPSGERPEGGLHFDTEDFTPEHVDKYNKLNTNKAIIEEYLRVLSNARRGTENLPWRTTINHEVSQDVREAHPQWEEGVWGTDPGFIIPAVGTWLWHSMLESFGADELKGRDTEGNLNFYSLPNDAANFRNRSYSYDEPKQRAYIRQLGRFRPTVQDIQQFIEDNQASYPDFTFRGTQNHVSQAWRAFGGRRGGIFDDDPGITMANFMDWINDVDANGNLRHQAWVNDAQDSFEAVPETEQERASRTSGEPREEYRGRIGAEREQANQAREEQEQAAEEQVEAERQRQQTEDDRTKELRQRIIDHEEGLGFIGDKDKEHLEEDLDRADLKALQRRWDDIQKEKLKERREQVRADKKTAGRKEPEEGLDEDQRKELIDEYVSSYREMHHQPVIPGWVKILEGMSDKDLVAKHRDLVDQFGASKRTEAQNHRENMANNVGYAIPSLAPQQKHLTKEDILLQARKLVHHQAAYGKLMSGDAKKVWKERYDEAHQLGNAANMDLELLMQKDRTEAEEPGDYGSTAWLERVGEAQEDVLTRRAGHKKAVNQGAELRANRNYKPHIVAQYDQDGSFLSYMDLRTGQPVDSHELGFDDDNHYFFHGLDPDKVKKYQQYQKLNKDHTPEIPNPFDPPVPSSDEDFEALKQEVHGAGYDDVRQRLDAVGELPGAHQVFHDKFTKHPTGRPGLPVAPDGSAEAAPRFYEDARDRQGMAGWYHPESESWINPYRHKYLLDSMEGQQGSGRVVLGGQSFLGRDRRGNQNVADPNRNYQFAIPTQAKQAKFRKGYGDQSYYVDDTGSIAHAHDSFANSHTQTHDQPQTVNGVIHDWYAQEINNHINASPQAFKDEQGKLRDVAEINAPQQPAVQAPPLQNMWLELQSPTNLGREPGSALERREKKKGMGWNWKSSKLGAVRHPLSGATRDPLTPQEMGQDKWWSGAKEAKQKWFDVIDYPQSQIISWAGRTLLPGITSENPEDSVIRRIRRGYKQQAVAERMVRDSASRTTVNGKRLSDIYVAPGEQKARGEDYKELSDYLRNRAAHHQIRRGEAQEAKNEENQKFHTAKNLHFRDEHNKLTRLKADMPNHWKQINDIYQAHLGRVNQAPPADEALQQWGGEMRQPQQEDWGVKMRQPSQQDPQQQASGIPNPFDSQSGSAADIPNPFAQQQSGGTEPVIPPVFSV